MIKTSTRWGGLENTQLQHYRTMRWDPLNRDPVMLIPEHKRFVDGAALLALDKVLDLVSIYGETTHPQFPSPREDYLFLQRSGKQFMNGTVNWRPPEMWHHSGIWLDLRVTATNIGKFIITVLQENKCVDFHVQYTKDGQELILARWSDSSSLSGSSHNNKTTHKQVAHQLLKRSIHKTSYLVYTKQYILILSRKKTRPHKHFAFTYTSRTNKGYDDDDDDNEAAVDKLSMSSKDNRANEAGREPLTSSSKNTGDMAILQGPSNLHEKNSKYF